MKLNFKKVLSFIKKKKLIWKIKKNFYWKIKLLKINLGVVGSLFKFKKRVGKKLIIGIN